jgi:hypothetical protein
MPHVTETSLPHSLAASAGFAGTPDTGAISDMVADLVSEIHEYAVPAFAASALDRLHGSLYASFRHLELCDAVRPTPHTWVAYRHGEVIGVLLFRMRGTQVIVLTEMIDIEQGIAAEFCRAVFSRFAYAEAVCFNAISLPRPLSGLVQQQFAFSENYVIELPRSVDEYQAALGKSTRKTIRGYGNRLRRDHPDLRWEVLQGTEMHRDALRRFIRQLLAFKRASMALRGKRAEISLRDAARMIKLASETGLIGIARLGDRICGGSLACRIGDNYVMLLSAADQAFEPYRLGMLCCFWSVCDCVRVGARECHLLWGRYQYKTQLLGNPRTLHRLTIYRSPLQMALSPSTVMRMAWMSFRYRLRNWLLDHTKNDGDGVPRWTSTALQFARGIVARAQRGRAILQSKRFSLLR